MQRKSLILPATVLLAVSLLLGYIFFSEKLAKKASNPSPESTQPYQIGFQSSTCWFDVPAERDVECGHFHTDEVNGRFRLPVVILRDRSEQRQPQPLVYLNGGPGGATGLAADAIEDWYYWFDQQKLKRDLILVDQRGVGMSEPTWRCDSYRSWLRKALRNNNSLAADSAAAFETIDQCFAAAGNRGFSFRFFSTTDNARDMALLMKHLDYRSWHVLGSSHGTRIALEWARNDPEGIDSLVLDSVYPVDKGLLREWPQLLHQSFSRFWSVCESESACDESLDAQQLQERFWQALQELRQRPVSLVVDSWNGDWPYNIVVNDHRFVGAAFTALYDNFLHSTLATALDEIISGGDYSALTAIMAQSVNSEVSPDFNTLVYFATECRETPLLVESDYQDMRQRYPRWMPYTEYDWSVDICQQIPKRADIEAFRVPVVSDIPTLILAGELDPITPVEWAEDLHRRLPNSQLVVARDVGHGVVATIPCGLYAVKFLTGEALNLPEECVAQSMQK